MLASKFVPYESSALSSSHEIAARLFTVWIFSDESIDTEFIVVGQKCRNNKDLAAALDVSVVFLLMISNTARIIHFIDNTELSQHKMLTQ